MRIDFTKMHGVGNDFVVFDAPADQSVLRPELLRSLADRRTGIGFDQALVLERPRRVAAAVFYRIFNSDGDEVEQAATARVALPRSCTSAAPAATACSPSTVLPGSCARASRPGMRYRSTWAYLTSTPAHCPSKPRARRTATRWRSPGAPWISARSR